MSTANTKTVEEGADPRGHRGLGKCDCEPRTPTDLVSQYTTDSVKFILAPPLQYTRDNPFDKKGLEDWFSSFQGAIGYEIRDLNITAGDEVGVLP